MLGSPILDVAIGLVLVFLLLSIIASAVREWIEALLRSRAVQLERGIRELLADPTGTGLASALYRHPLISSLYRGGYDGEKITSGRFAPYHSNLPAYIPKENFALAMMDLVVRGTDVTNPLTARAGAMRIEVGSVRAQVATLQNPAVQRVLLTALDTAGGDLNQLRRNLEDWFDGAMDRVAGWYKRESQYFLIVIGLVLAVAGNVDTIAVGRYLYANKGARDAMVAQAGVVARDSAQLARSPDFIARELAAMHLPIGWTRPGVPLTSAYVASQAATGWLGWILTAFAISFGAPFWFDLLNRFVVVRSTVKPREKSGDERSKDDGTPARPSEPAPRRIAWVAPTDGGGPDASRPVAFIPNEWAAGDPDAGLL